MFESSGELIMEEKDVLVIKRRGDGCKSFSIRIDEELANRIEKISAEAKISRNEAISQMLEFAVERCKLK